MKLFSVKFRRLKLYPHTLRVFIIFLLAEFVGFALSG